MTERDLDTLAQIIGRFRATEIEPLARRLDAIEQRQNFEARIARLEARAISDANDPTVIDFGDIRRARRGGQ
jgi:hypothetical protein